MQQLRVCFIGVGSIAKRHIRNLRDVCEQRKIKLHMDAFRHSADKQSAVDGIETVYYDIAQMPDFNEVYPTYFTDGYLPARIAMQISALAGGAHLEVEAEAILN